MTNDSKTTDRRIEAAAAAMWEQRPMMRTDDGAPRPWDEVPARSYGARYRGQAQVALAAADAVDPRKPRTITTVEELDALPEGSVVISGEYRHYRNGMQLSFQKWDDGRWHRGGRSRDTHPDYFLPATVLHEPEVEAAA